MLNRCKNLRMFGVLLTITFHGCNSNTKTDQTDVEKNAAGSDASAAFDLAAITIVVIDDEPLSKAIAREWTANTGGELVCRNESIELFRNQKVVDGDVFVFPSELLGEFASRSLIRPLPKNASDVMQLSDILPLSRNQEMRWAKELYAVSIGSPQFTLMYRSDIFKELNLEPPKTWNDYQSICESLTTSKGALASLLAQPFSLTAEPIAEGWAAKTFLARAASYARNQNEYSCLFNIVTMKPQIAAPPFVRALNELRAMMSYMPDDVKQMSPCDIASRFANKSLAMAVTWPSASMENRSNVEMSIDAGFSVIPGAIDTYIFSKNEWQKRDDVVSVPLLGISGRLVAISKSTRNLQNANNLITWLCAAEQGSRVANRSQATTPFRYSQAGQVSLWMEKAFRNNGHDYFEVILRNQSQPICLNVPTMPGSNRYLGVLDKAIRTAVTNSESANSILESVAKEWDAISDELGRHEQARGYSQSLGVSGI